MRFVSPVALGLVMAMAGVSLGAAAPAAFAKEKAAQAPKLKLSPAFVPQIMKVQEVLNKKDVEGTKAALAAAEPFATTNDDKYQYYALMLNLSILANDAAMQGRAVGAMLDTGLVPAGQQGQFNLVAASGDLDAKKYDSALARAQKALAAGWNPGGSNVAIAQALWGKAGTKGLSSEPARSLVAQGLTAFRAGIDAMKAKGEAIPSQWYQVAVGKAEAAGLPEINDWAQLGFQADPSGENLRTVLRVLQRRNPNMSNRENLDLLRLMSASGGLAVKYDYTEYAEMAFKAGIFGEVKAAIDAGRAKGVLTAADGSDLYSVAAQKITADRASLASGEADAARSATSVAASATGDAYLGYGNYAKAISLYKLALTKKGVDANEVNTHMGVALFRSGDMAGASAAFAQVTGGIRGEVAKYWMAWLKGKAAA